MPSETFTPVLQSIDNYDLIEKIADGGMGTVYRGRHRVSGEMFAVKLLAKQMTSNGTYLQRFVKEYSAARALDHPNIVRAIEQGIADGQPYLVMEFVDGESIGQIIERNGRFPEKEAIRIICEAARGLQQAHSQGLIHRDVKPDNIMVTRDGRVKLADLGLVKELDTDMNLTRTGRGLGTPHFMAPEQFRNAKNADVRCDVYSLGATLYMMVTGQMPFAGCPPLEAWMKKVGNELTPARKIIPSLSERVNWAIQQAMDSNPANRAATCLQFIDDLTSDKPIQVVAVPEQSVEWWYLQYSDDEGRARLVKGKVSGIRRSIKEGRLGDVRKVLVSQTKKGPYGPLHGFEEFRDLVPSAPARPKNPALEDSTFTPTPAESGIGTNPQVSLPQSQPVESSQARWNVARSGINDWVKLGLLIGAAVGLGVLMATLMSK
jgi:serine/threonine protein kinase